MKANNESPFKEQQMAYICLYLLHKFNSLLKTLSSEGYTGEFYKIFMKKNNIDSTQILPENRRGENNLNSFYEAILSRYQHQMKMLQENKPTDQYPSCN